MKREEKAAQAGRSLKILHIDPETNWGGGESQVMGLLSYLSRNGHRNHLLCHPRGVLFQEAKKLDVEVLPLSMRNDLDLRPVFRLRRRIRREAYEIVHFHTKRGHALSLWFGRPHPAVKYIVTRRMDYPVKKGWYTNCLYNRKVDGVVAISRKIAEVLIAGGVRAEKIRVIHSGIDPDCFRAMAECPSAPGEIVIGTVAALEERKGHRFLLQAAAVLKAQGHRVRYRLAGEGTQMEPLKKIVVQSGLESDVEFAGFVTDIPKFLSSVDLFVLPSLYEGLGISVLEAMAAGKPVVASRTGGIPEIVMDRVTGVLVPPQDPQALARAIAELVSHNGLRRMMGEKGRERVLKDFTLAEMAKKNENFYYELIGAHPAGNPGRGGG
ncbi:MAG: glycosyltransferase family 4 protein [Deltaproteobacteria bacterium]|nr:glycosyltransferase family 4 protein [Deltaproteobacteria bacterium]